MSACMTQASSLAAEANELFIRDKNYDEAIRLYTQAIELLPQEVRFFGNRSMAFLMAGDAEKALEDAVVCTQLEPVWAKGHYRKAAALENLGRLEEAEEAYGAAEKYSGKGSIASRDYATAKLHCQIRRLEALGYSREQATAAMLEYGSVQRAAHCLSLTRLSLQTQVAGELFDSDDESALGSVMEMSAVSQSQAPQLTRPLSAVNVTYASLSAKNRSVEEVGRPKRLATPPSANPNDPLTDPRNPLHCDTLWIGNLAKSVTEEDLRRKFAMFGRIRDLALKLDRHCGFVSFKDWHSAGKAMGELQDVSFHGSNLCIKYPDRAIGGPVMKNVVLKKNRK